MQDLCLDLSKQLCILSLCRGVRRVWGQISSKIPARMGSPGGRPPAYLTSSNDCALYQEHILGGPGGWGGGPNNRSPDLNFGRGDVELNSRATTAVSTCSGGLTEPNVLVKRAAVTAPQQSLPAHLGPQTWQHA
eukprot:1153920-Pelagomonas_calceolata.AAC.1